MKKIIITASDGVRLVGYFYERKKNAPIVIFFNGLWSTGFVNGKPIYRITEKHNWNLLLATLRAHGESGGEYSTFGALEKYDCRDWVSWARKRFGTESLIFLMGMVCIFKGLKDWKDVQNKENHKKDLENEKLELENKKLKDEFGLSSKEQFDKVEQEVKEEQEIIGEQSSTSLIKEYFNIEQRVATKIIKDFSKSHDVVYGFRLGKYEYDIVAKGKGFLDKDYFFEIKYLKNMINVAWYKKIIEKVNKQNENYQENTNRKPYVKIVFVTEKNNYNQVKEFINRQQKINNLGVDIVEKDEIEQYYFRY